MKGKKSAFLFPLHEPKFEYGNYLISSFNKFLPEYQIFIVFSNERESSKFRIDYKPLRFNSIVYPYSPDGGIINKKKFFGIQKIIDTTDFEYIACIDSEGVILQSVNIDLRFENYYRRKTLFASYTIDNDFINKVIQSPFQFFSSNEVQRLTSILDSCRLYYWFNDIPVYRRDNFKRFAEHVKLEEKLETLTWFDFDFLLYSYYCLLYEGFEIKVIDNQRLDVSFMESQNEMNIFSFIRGLYKINTSWIKKRTLLYPYAFMTFHNDRSESKNNFSVIIKKIIKKIIKISNLNLFIL